ncbi:unnamed protein product [Amoebophrya sp. A25]|nr:unnamed protein product [Amoebophrya sp. A25]|eukprot:GSA25T00026095001.1
MKFQFKEKLVEQLGFTLEHAHAAAANAVPAVTAPSSDNTRVIAIAALVISAILAATLVLCICGCCIGMCVARSREAEQTGALDEARRLIDFAQNNEAGGPREPSQAAPPPVVNFQGSGRRLGSTESERTQVAGL